jgi:hypothetical protein
MSTLMMLTPSQSTLIYIPTHHEEGNDDPNHTQDTEEIQFSGFQVLDTNLPEDHTKEGCKPPAYAMPDLLDMTNTFAEDE